MIDLESAVKIYAELLFLYFTTITVRVLSYSQKFEISLKFVNTFRLSLRKQITQSYNLQPAHILKITIFYY